MIGAVVCVKTKVSDEEPVVFDTGYLHSWGSRITGLNIRPDYTNTLGSRVHFPRALLAATYADTELFQFVSTLSLSASLSFSLWLILFGRGRVSVSNVKRDPTLETNKTESETEMLTLRPDEADSLPSTLKPRPDV